MGIAKQLFELQEVDLEVESGERALEQIARQLGESPAVARVRNELEEKQQQLAELGHEQHSAEWELDDIGNKLAKAEKELYGGRIQNPKELTNLQHEVEGLQAKRGQLEERALAMMGRVELAGAEVTTLTGELGTLEAEWRRQQLKLAADMEQLKATLAELKQKRQRLSAGLDPEAVKLYQGLKKQKGQAVVRVEQGVCRGCRISLPTTELQRVRGGGLVQCSSCGRILFLL